MTDSEILKSAKDKGVSVCGIYCKPCEWYGICPHSYAEFDAEEVEDVEEVKE